ncbi:lytic transglycosylase domain-containing protein [Burkholderia gladioli]|uniref:lytic transglycosylase domain-containing protein n=1 Tax=Burkholderia gladioli TaxID=28095 RepID=UPI00264CB1ED|nr:lytic transglycosylase domain-containing protein [Burkholderia gladioli]MDN7741872.1 lytic transglycosylase domain-containing protein [Burkholderia gladioli]
MSMSVDAAGSSTLDPYQSSGQGNTQALQQLAQLEQLIQQLIAELQMFSQLNNLANQKPSPSVGGAGGGGGGMPALSDGGGGGGGGAPQTLAAAPGGAPDAADASPPTGSGAPATAGASSVQATPDASGGDMTPQEVASKYKDEIMSASQSTGVPPGIIAGQIWQESKGIANTPGGGLMQLGPNEFQQYGGGDISNPADNIRAGANYMKDLANQFGGNMGAALRAYNSGPNGVDLGNLNATPAGTGDPTYVQKVMQAAQQSGLATA